MVIKKGREKSFQQKLIVIFFNQKEEKRKDGF
jgi:hypothetical protein